jgi:hypothetical protein
MNMTTKLLVIINLLLAAVFAGMAANWYVHSENWKKRWDVDTRNLSGDLDLMKKEVFKQSVRASDAESALASQTAQVDSLQKESQSLASQLQVKEKEIQGQNLRISTLNDDLQSKESLLASKEESLNKLNQRNTELSHIAEVARGVAFNLNVKLAEIEDDLNNSNVKLGKAEETIAGLQDDGKRKDAMLKLVEDRYPRVFEEVSTNPKGYDHIVQGMVAAVRDNPQGQQDLVMLTVGADDHVQEGMEFIIYRGDQYIVKVQARKVMPDMVACWVVPESWNAQGLKIQQGDVAQNRLF